MGGYRSMIIQKANSDCGIGGEAIDVYAPTKDDMDLYFQTALGQSYDSTTAHTKANWCGIWAVYILNCAGMDARWGPISGGWGVSSGWVQRHNGYEGARAGDIGYCRYINGNLADHHFIILDVAAEYDYVECMDGNAVGPGFGTIKRIRTRSLSDINVYYEILDS